MSACQRGLDQWEWELWVLEPQSKLGHQLRHRGGTKPRPAEQVRKDLDDAWESATAFVSENPAFTAQDIRDVATAVHAFAADPEAPLSDSERAVLAFAAQEAHRFRTTRPALPRRAIQAATGLPERTTRTTLDRLNDRGLLVIAVPGRSGDPTAPGKRGPRATLYRLPSAETIATAYLYRETRSMRPPAKTYGTPAATILGTPAKTYGTPDPAPGQQAGSPAASAEVTLALSAADAEAVVDFLARRAAKEQGAAVHELPAVVEHRSSRTPEKRGSMPSEIIEETA